MEAFICTGLVQQILLPKESLEALGHHRGPGHALSPQLKYNMCFNKGDPQVVQESRSICRKILGLVGPFNKITVSSLSIIKDSVIIR